MRSLCTFAARGKTEYILRDNSGKEEGHGTRLSFRNYGLKLLWAGPSLWPLEMAVPAMPAVLSAGALREV